MSFLLDIFYVFGEAIKNVIFILISIQEMSLKENDKSLSSGSFLFRFIFVMWIAVQFTRAHSQNAVQGFLTASLFRLLMKAGAPCMSLSVLQSLCEHKTGSAWTGHA